MQWSGDVDLNDGCLQEQYEAYKKRLESVNTIDLKGHTVKQLMKCEDELVEDIEFVHSCKS